jgi:hypothetical protein
MSAYQILLIDKVTHEPVGLAETIDAASDNDAVSSALQRTDGRIVEVWKGNQRIIQFERSSKRSAS